MSRFVIAILTGTVMCSGAAFTNGSFENNDGTPACNPGSGSFATISSSSNCISGWTASNIDYINGYWTADDGTHSIDLNSITAGTIQQTFDVNNGHTYQVTFFLAGNPDLPPSVKTLNVTVAGGTHLFSFDDTEQIADGTHERFVINVERFAARLKEKATS